MRRAAIGQHHVIGDIDQGRDRALARAFQAVLQPLGRGGVSDARDNAAIKRRATCGVIGADRQWAGETAGDMRRGDRFQRAEPGGGQIARDPVKPHAIRPVGGDRHIEHRIAALIIGETLPDRRIAGQFKDPVVLIAQLQLADRTHHAVRFDPADCADLQFKPAARNHRAGQAEHADHAGAGIGRAADHLQRRTGPGIDAEHLQLVSIGVALRADHPRDAKTCEPIGGVFDPLNLQPDGV